MQEIIFNNNENLGEFVGKVKAEFEREGGQVKVLCESPRFVMDLVLNKPSILADGTTIFLGEVVAQLLHEAGLPKGELDWRGKVGMPISDRYSMYLVYQPM